MPDVTYSPTQGRQSSVSAEERLAQDQRDFLFRSQLAQQQQANEQARMAAAQGAQGAQERMHAEDLAQNLAINGDFGARTGAARDMAGMQNQQAQSLESMRGKTQLDAARIGAGPGMAALGLQERAYNDTRSDRMNDPEYLIKSQIAKSMGGGVPSAPTSASPAMAGVGATTNGTLPANVPGDQAGNPTTGSESTVTPTQGASPKPQRGGMMAGSFGPSGKQYEFDDKSAEDQSSMLDQLKGQVDPARFQQAVANLDNSRLQQSQRHVAAINAREALMKASVPDYKPTQQFANPGDPSLPAQAPTVNPMVEAYMRKTFGESPDVVQGRGNRQELMKAALSSDDPVTKAEGVKMTLSPGYTPDTSKMFPQSPTAAIGKTTAAYEAFKGSPQYQTALSQIQTLAQQGDEQSGAQAKQIMDGIIQQAAGMGAAADSVRNDLTMALDQARPREGGVFAGAPWRSSTQFRRAAGLYQPDLMTPQ